MKTSVKLIIQFAFLLFALGFIAMRPFRLIVVHGPSMMPTYHSRQAVFAVRSSKFERGDVVIIYDPANNETFIKRIAAMEGDCYWQYLWHDANGDAQHAYWFGPKAEKQAKEFMKQNKNIGRLMRYTVQRNYVFVLGDNPNNSFDSRDFGPIPIWYILYKVI